VTVGVVIALLCVVGVALAMSGSNDPISSALKRLTGQSPSAPPEPCPLTGVAPQGGREVPRRPLLAIKVENTSAAYPLAGLEKADIVYEEIVESGITRLALMFQSQAPDKIGPVRSVRNTDQAIVWPVGGIFAYSGGAQVNVNAINAAPVHAIDESAAQANVEALPLSRIAPALLGTQGGLSIDADARVLRPDGSPIPNLYAPRDHRPASRAAGVSRLRRRTSRPERGGSASTGDPGGASTGPLA
jgi:hypothetical protein